MAGNSKTTRSEKADTEEGNPDLLPKLPFKTWPFYPTICQHCFEPSESVKRCTGCKTMPYCSRDHQKLDWPSHRKLCRAMRTSNEKVPYNIRSHRDLFDYKAALKIAWEATLGRPLEPYECTVFIYLRICEVCFKRDGLFDCEGCGCVSYCGVEHQGANAGSHAKVCDRLELCKKIDLYSSKYLIRTDKIDLLDSGFPRDMDEFVRKLRMEKTNRLVRCIYGYLLSPCGTIMHAIQKTGFKNGKLVIHIVGASMVEDKYNWAAFARALKTYFPFLENLSFVFIGPEIFNAHPLVLPVKTIKATIRHHRNFYHDIVHRLDAPDMIFAFNCGLHEFHNQRDTWKPTIPHLLRPGVPLTLTAYTKDELVKDRAILFNFTTEIDVIEECTKNRFASLKPFRNWNDPVTSIYYNNYYIFMCQRSQ